MVEAQWAAGHLRRIAMGLAVALALGAGFAAIGSVMSFLRLTIPATKP